MRELERRGAALARGQLRLSGARRGGGAEATTALLPADLPADVAEHHFGALLQEQAAFALMDAEVLTKEALCMAERHDIALLLSAAPGLTGEIMRRRLAPLQAVAGAHARANLTLTLAAWLRHPGQRKAIAHELGVHPQTVGYRMARLHKLFGSALEDPEQRFELDLAMRLARYAEPAQAA